MRSVLVAALLALGAPAGTPATANMPPLAQEAAAVRSLKITVLSTMLADEGIGEWGYAALVVADTRKFLFDTGARPETVLRNAAELNIDLADVTDVILSHNHDDHTGGLLTLRNALRERNPAALGRLHVGRGIFWSRPGADGGETNGAIALRTAYEATGGVVVEHSRPAELAPGVWFTGPVPRVHPERNWSGTGKVRTPDAVVEDNVPEDASLVISTPDGLVILSGCGHSGVVNTSLFARALVADAPVLALIGGFHLFSAPDAVLTWTGEQLRAMGVRYFLGGHCTGIEATMQLRVLLDLDRRTAVVSAVGSSFTLGAGIDPLHIAR